MSEVLAPVRIHVSETYAHCDRPRETGDALMDALAAHLQRIACEGARAAFCRAPMAQEWMEKETGRKGWRAQVQRDTAHLMHVVEELGLMEFDDA